MQERQRETIKEVDANTTLQLGKFFPDFLSVQLPMYLGYSETVSTPQFDPLSPMEIADAGLSTERKKKSQQIDRIRSINFSNIKIDPEIGGKGKKDKKKGGKDLNGETASRLKRLTMSPQQSWRPNAGSGRPSNKGATARGHPGLRSGQPERQLRLHRELAGHQHRVQHSPELPRWTAIRFHQPAQGNQAVCMDGALQGPRWLTDFNFYPGLKQVSVNMGMDRTCEASRVRNNTAELLGIETGVLVSTRVLKQWN